MQKISVSRPQQHSTHKKLIDILLPTNGYALDGRCCDGGSNLMRRRRRRHVWYVCRPAVWQRRQFCDDVFLLLQVFLRGTQHSLQGEPTGPHLPSPCHSLRGNSTQTLLTLSPPSQAF